MGNNIELNGHHVNAKIKGYVLSESDMKYHNFYLREDGLWHFFKDLGNEIGMYIHINPNAPSDISIDVLDEYFLQPYDFQYMLESNPTFKPALIAKKKVESIMKDLAEAGIITGHRYGEYI